MKDILVNNFLGFNIVKNNDGIVVSTGIVNPMPGACCFSSIEDAKLGILRYILASNVEFDAAVFWRLYGRRGASSEYFTLKKWAENKGFEIPEGVDWDEDGCITFLGKII